MSTEENVNWASVSAIGNTGFAFALFITGFTYTGLVPFADSLGILIFTLLCLIGLGYFLASIIELRNNMGSTGFVILVWSLFGFIAGFVYLFTYAIPILSQPSPTTFLMFWLFWIFMALVSGVVLRPLGKMISANLYWLAITFAFLAAAAYGNTIVIFTAGIISLAQSLYNWYLTAAIIINNTYRKNIIPLK
ncbi:MAG: hypothetical protein F7B59_01915 [Desulfurococcales archaeon]|nr:hypothetical protein [Desulfurococcales archaeon]